MSIIVVFSSCRTVDQAANRHLRLALKLNPNIIKNTTTDTTLSIRIQDSVKTPDVVGEGVLNCDSIMKAYNKMLADGKTGGVLIHKDNNIEIGVKTPTPAEAAKGVKPKLYYLIKGKTVYFDIVKTITIKAPSKTFNVPTDRPFYVYKWFWFMLLAIIILLVVVFKNTKPVQYVIEKVKGTKTP